MITRKKPSRRRVWPALRRSVVFFFVTILLLAGGLVINAFRLPSRQFKTSLAEKIDVDVQATANILAEFLAVPSYSYEDRSKMDSAQFLKLHDILQDRFPAAHQVLQREVVNELSLLYKWQGRDKTLEPILLMSHLDVVPIEQGTRDKWTHAPEEETVAEGFVWGRGALDVKCGVIGMMSAIERLVTDGLVPERTIYLAFGHDEEVGGKDGNAVIAQQFRDQGIRLAFVHDEGGAILNGVIPGVSAPVAFIAIAEKRYVYLKITARGAGGHGSMPGRSAILNLAETIIRLDEHPMPVRLTKSTESLFDFLGPEMSLGQRTVMGNRWLFGSLIARQFTRSPSTNAVVRSTLSVTQIGTKTAPNQNATEAIATINVRLLPGDTAEQVRNHVLALTRNLRLPDGKPAVECEVEGDAKGELVSPVNCPEFKALQQTIHQVFPDVIVAAGLTSVSTDSSWYYGVTDKVYRFIPMRVKPVDIERIHGINERIATENMAEIVRFYVQLIRNTAGPAFASDGGKGSR